MGKRWVSWRNHLFTENRKREMRASNSIFISLNLLLLATEISSSATFCSQNDYFCVTGSTDNSTTTCFAISSKAKGWTALGVGSSQMDGADMYVGWKNSAGTGYTVANLDGRDRVQPLPFAKSNIASVNVTAPTTSAADGLAFTVCLKDNKKITKGQSFIFAYSFQTPSQPDSASSAFEFHDFYGSFSADFTTASGVSDNSSVVGGNGPVVKTENYGQIAAVHGVLMWISWILFSTAGIFTARYLKAALPNHWFPIHKFFMGIGAVVVSLVSFIVIYLYKTPPHFVSSHEKIGISILVMMIAEAILGWAIDQLYEPSRQSVPLRDKAHWWVGRCILLLAVINVQLGFDLFNEKKLNGGVGVGYVAGNWIVLGLFFVAALFMEWRRFNGLDAHGAHVPIDSAANIVASPPEGS